MKKIGILGGTFDPPHLGHLIIAEEVRYQMQLDEIWFIPTNIPPHKKEASTDKQHRVNMLKKATESNRFFSIHTIEVEKEEKSYTIHTIKELKSIYPGYEFYFIIGADMVEYLPKWHQIESLQKLITFIGVGRPGYSEEAEGVIQVNVPQLDLSSSMIREKIKNQEPVQYFMTENVYQYIKENKLYGS